jgi:peptidoglycan/LPS O-acetylase OafA/YrhL
MTESLTRPKRLQWKWVLITLTMYILFCILPIFIIGNYFTHRVGVQFISSWMFGEIILVAAVAVYLSHDITIWEPALAGAGLAIAFFLSMIVYIRIFVNPGYKITGKIILFLVPTTTVFLLTLLGAWLGERLHKFLKNKSQGSS